MIAVKAGDVLEMNGKRFGVAKNGEYFVFEVKGEKGSDRISVFASNPRAKGLKECNRAKVLSIQEVKLTKRQVNGNWYQNYTASCELEPIIETDKKFDDFMAGPTEEEINALFGL